MMPSWQFLTYTLNLFIDPDRSSFLHAWSLCVEEQFYLLFPLLALWLIRNAAWRRGVIVVLALGLCGVVVRGWLWVHFVHPIEASGGDAQNAYLRFLYYPTYARLDDLLGGVVLAAARSYNTRGWKWIDRHANSVAATGVLLIILCMWGFDGRRMDFAANVVGYPVLAFAMTALVAAASKNGVLAKVRVPGAAWFATASYSLYLSHKIVYRELHAQFAPWINGNSIWTALIYIVAILAIGAALHYAVGRPFLKLREPVRRRLSQRRFRRVADSAV